MSTGHCRQGNPEEGKKDEDLSLWVSTLYVENYVYFECEFEKVSMLTIKAWEGHLQAWGKRAVDWEQLRDLPRDTCTS